MGKPKLGMQFGRKEADKLLEVNCGPHALDACHEFNIQFLYAENGLANLYMEVDSLPDHGSKELQDRIQLLHEYIFRELDRLDGYQECEWQKQQTDEGNNEDMDTKIHTGKLVILTICRTILTMSPFRGLPVVHNGRGNVVKEASVRYAIHIKATG